MFNLDDLNPSKKCYWDESNDEWVCFRLISDAEMQKIRKALGLKIKQKYIPNTITKKMEPVIDGDDNDDIMMKFNDAIICYQIESWNLVQKNKEVIECNDENKLKLFYGSPVFAKWANKRLEELQDELNKIEEEEIKN